MVSFDGMKNEKRRRFCAEYLVDLNATQAAIRAGYSEKTAYSQGQRLLKNAEIKQYLSKAMAKRAEEAKIDADWVLAELKTNLRLAREREEIGHANKAIELIGKHTNIGAFTDKLDVTSQGERVGIDVGVVIQNLIEQPDFLEFQRQRALRIADDEPG